MMIDNQNLYLILGWVGKIGYVVSVGWVAWLYKRLDSIESHENRIMKLEQKAEFSAPHFDELVTKVDELRLSNVQKEARLALIEKAISEIAPTIPKLNEAVVRLTTLVEMWKKPNAN